MTKPKKKPATQSGRLKVFMTQIGFHKWLVAAPSQKAALAAWDVRENLFAMGSAEQVSEPDCVALAMKTPGTPVALEAEHAFAKASKVLRLDDHRKVKRPEPPRKAAAARPAKKKPRRRKADRIRADRTRADRSRLDKAEAALEAFRKQAVRERAAIMRAQKALDLKAEALEGGLEAEQEKLQGALKSARDAYEAEAAD